MTNHRPETATPTILVFDSGVGGLSVLDETRRRLPHCRYHYACDNAAFPYGDKSEDELVARVDAVLRALIARVHPDIVVIACNTASTVALPRIRAGFHKPVVGVVPAIKPAAQLSRSRVMGLVATPGTINRPYTQWLVDDYAGDCEIIRVGSTRLVHMAEAKLRGETPDPAELAEILAPVFDDPRVDTVVLACTHFPLLRDELIRVAPRALQWVDSGEAIARRVASFTGEAPAGTAPGLPGFHCWLTANGRERQRLEAGLAARGGTPVELIAVDPGET